jgi:hypothetical protein
LKEEEQDDSEKNQNQEQQPHLSLSTQAYQLFSKGKTPIQVSIELNLRESEATEFYKEYWNLKQLHNLKMVYEEIKDDIGFFVELYKLAKAKGMGVQQVVDILAIANNDLPAIKERFKRLRNDVSMLQSQKRICERNLYQLKSQISTTSRLFKSLCISCERERRGIEYLCNEKAILAAIVTEFKNNNEQYVKTRQIAEKYVKNALTNGKLLLKFATASVIESLRRNPELYNSVIYDNSNSITISYGSKFSSLMLSEQEQPSNNTGDDTIYISLILEVAEKMYNNLTTKLTNGIISAAAMMTSSSLLPSGNNN